MEQAKADIQYKVIEYPVQVRTTLNTVLFGLFALSTLVLPLIITSVYAPRSIWWILVPLLAIAVLGIIEYVNFPFQLGGAIMLFGWSLFSYSGLALSSASSIDGLRVYFVLQVFCISVYAPLALAMFFLRHVSGHGILNAIFMLMLAGFVLAFGLTGPFLAIAYGAFALQGEIQLNAGHIAIATITSIGFFVRLFTRDNYVQDIPPGAPTKLVRWRVPKNSPVLGPHTELPDDPSVPFPRFGKVKV